MIFFTLLFSFEANSKTYLYYINSAHKITAAQASDGALAFKNAMINHNITGSNGVGIIEPQNLKFIVNNGYSSLGAWYQIDVSDAALSTKSINLDNSDLSDYYLDLAERYRLITQIDSDCISLPSIPKLLPGLPGGGLIKAGCESIKQTATLTLSMYKELKDLLNKGDSVIIVGHGQGNLYIEAVSALLFAEKNATYNLNKQYRVISMANTAATTFNGVYVNIAQDGIIYSDLVSIPRQVWKPMKKNFEACIYHCLVRPETGTELNKFTNDFFTHGVKETYLNKDLDLWPMDRSYHISPDELIAKLVLKSWFSIKLANGSKKTQKINFNSPNTPPQKTSTSIQKTTSNELFTTIASTYTVRVEGTGFDGNEAVSITGSTCDIATIKRGDGYFTETCTAGSEAGNDYKIRVFDTTYDLDIDVPAEYQYMSLRGVVLAPTAPTLTDMGNGTIRVSWSAVSGATSYIVSKGTQLKATLGAETQLDMPNNAAGSTACFRVRAITNGLMSANSAETCLTLDAKTCTGKWNSGYFNIGEYESTTQSCAAGFTGNKTLSHTCQDDPQSSTYGMWSNDTVQDNCVKSAITCQGAWTTTKYLVDQIETKTEACTGGQTGNIVTSHTCRTNSTWTPTSINTTCACPAGKVLLNGVCSTPLPTTCTGSWHAQSYAIGAVEDQYANSCPAGTTGQVRQFHTCLTGGIWSAIANSDNCTAVLVAPTGLNISSVTGGIQITWTAVSGATKYLITRDGDTTYSSVSSANYVDPNSGTGINRCYKIAAFSSFNNSTSPNSVEVCASHENDSISISPPSNVVASQYISNGRKAIRLTWNSASGADSYYIYRRDRAGIFAPVSGQDTSFVDWPEFSLTSGISYCYFIRSIKNGVVSLESNDACAIAP